MIEKHLDEQKILASEQKGCVRGSKGVHEQLIIDQVITEQAKRKRRNIAVSWIDYQKAYDSVPHEWLLKVLKIYKINPTIQRFLKNTMRTWKTRLCVKTKQCSIETDFIHVKKGIFQGDTWSPKWFTIALNPLSQILNETKCGYKVNNNTSITHLLYVDDLKLFAPDEKKLASLIETTALFSEDIGMSFGVSKCATLIIKKGTLQIQKEINLPISRLELPVVTDDHPYKYLGLEQVLTMEPTRLKEGIQRKVWSRTNKILRSDLNGKNTIKAINSWALPVITHTFGILSWSRTDIEKVERGIRVRMTRNLYHHPRACIERLYLPRKIGGRGLLSLKYLHSKLTLDLRNHFLEMARNDTFIKGIVKEDTFSPLQLNKELILNEHASHRVKQLNQWRTKVLHGRYLKDLELCHSHSNKWLLKCYLYGETEGFYFAIQDQVVKTRNYQKFIMKQNVDDICRACHQKSETIQHITAGCSVLAPTDYLSRHNLTAGIIHQQIVKFYGLNVEEENTLYYKYKPISILENEEVKILWDTSIITDHIIKHNRPDIVLIVKKTKMVKFIDIAHPLDHNVNEKYAEKLNKYKELAGEVKRIWKMDSVEIIPIIISVNGLVKLPVINNLKNLQMEDNILNKIMKNVVLETCRIVRKFIDEESN